MTNPSTALSKKSSSSSIISLKKTLGDLPPNSKVTGIILSLAFFIMIFPVVVSPVKATLLIPVCVANASPASAPKPLTIFNNPAGNKSSINSTKCNTDTGVCSAGFNTTALPVTKAGAIFQVAISIGKFHGII